MNNIYAQRIETLRQIMVQNEWDAVIIGGSDPHSSEYPSIRWKQVEWLCGFTGEAGDLVITRSHAGLWTDSRYFIQANYQLSGTGVELHKTRVPGEVPISQWLSKRADVVAVDSLCQTVAFIDELYSALEQSHKQDESYFNIVDVPDLLSQIWLDRPSIPLTPVTTLGIEAFGGIPRLDKFSWIREWMLNEGVDRVLLTSLDEIAWMLNVRGNDVDYNPLVISYLLIGHDFANWYVMKDNSDDVSQDTLDSYQELQDDGVTIDFYDSVQSGIFDSASQDGAYRIFFDPATLNYNIYKTILESYPESSVVQGISPVILKKSVKVRSEIDSLRQTHIQDGVAMENFLFWLESKLEAGEKITEWDASVQLTSLRAANPCYRGNSFETISAYGPSGALPHYVTPVVNSPFIEKKGLYLVDSGGHYLSGTTDITRTVPLGECTPLEKEDYTLVLKGMIDLSMAVFPEGTAGCQLDILARNPLWQRKRNFGHGTGHGVGFYLCVHEGPQSIRQNLNPQALLPGMVTSNEPAIYREGLHGVRHENILLCKASDSNNFGQWLMFETLTLCHIDTSAIVPELLTQGEKDWLNSYNRMVYERLSEHLPDDVSAWLLSKVSPI